MGQAGLTARQAEIVAFFREYQSANGVPPTYREVAQMFGIKSLNGVRCHYKALMKKGAMFCVPGQSRNVRLVGEPAEDDGEKRLKLIALALLEGDTIGALRMARKWKELQSE